MTPTQQPVAADLTAQKLSRELIRLADILRDCNRLVSPGGTAEAILREAAAALGSAPATPVAEAGALPPVRWWSGVFGSPDKLANLLDEYSEKKESPRRDERVMRAAAKWIREVLATPVPALAEELHTVSQFSMIAKLGKRLAELLDEDQWAECEEMLLAIENGPWRNLATPVQPVPASTELQNSAPRRIYLDIGDQFALERVLSGGLSWQSLEGVTWSEDNATSHGVEYVRADLAAPTAPASAPATPAAIEAVIRAKYDELLFAVARKYPGQSRHETALMYIQQAEASDSDYDKSASHPKESA